MVKLLLKFIWFGFGVFGLVTIGQKYWPEVRPAALIKGVQDTKVEDLKNLDPQAASQVLGTMVKAEVVKILEATGEQVRSFPAKQVRKIKIGACEELLEEDICSVAREIQCQ